MRVHKKIGTKERLLEMFQNVNNVKINETAMWGEKINNESFDNPKAKDKEYLDNTVGDQTSQVSKYDDGTRYPVEDKLKVKDPSLEKMKGDDAPIIEGFGDEDDQNVADENSEESQFDVNPEEEPVDNDGGEKKPAWDEDFGGEEDSKGTDGTEVEDPEMAMDTIPADDADAPELDAEIEGGEQMTNTMEEPHEDQIEGGLADDAQPNDFCPVQIAKGIQIEMEHTDDPHKALEIAMDHLTEIPDYYDRLEAMEAEAKGEGMESDMGAPEDSLLDPSKHWVDDYAPQNVSMGDIGDEIPAEDEIGEEPMEENSQNQGTPEEKYQIYLDQANDGNGNDSTTGQPLLSFDEWLNN